MNVTVDERLKEKGSLEREWLELTEIIKKGLPYEELRPMFLTNIAHSLAVIADAIGERKPDEPQTETSTNSEKLQPVFEVKQTDCPWK